MILGLLACLSFVSCRILSRRDSGVPGFDYNNDTIRGVNLGGWFVLEPYMNPSLFGSGDNVPVDEYHWTEQKGKDEASSILEQHWDSWIQESDFENLEQWGFNFARIPIGYWAFLALPGDPYVQGQMKYLDRAIGWARAHSIKLWIDLHGVPGSQNGFDNSGLRDSLRFQDGANTNLTMLALDILLNRYAAPLYYDVIIGIEVVNEPLGPELSMDKLHAYYDDAYHSLRDFGDQGAVFHDAFMDIGYFEDWLNVPDYYNCVIDHHFYQVFSVGELNRTIDEHIDFACNQGRELSTMENKWRVVGEWSGALTDCAPQLNGVGRGARFDATYENSKAIGTCSGMNNVTQWTDEHRQNTRRYIEAQLDAYEHGGSGWVYWSYKTENAVEWDVQRLISAGLFPNPVTDRQYLNQCGF